MGGFLTFTLGISDRYVTKELFNARMETMEAKVTGARDATMTTERVLSAQIDALRAEIRASGKNQ